MSGLLSVIEGNPRRGRKARRKKSHKAKARKSRRRRVRASNPSHRRVHHRRKSHRRRHRNPGIGGGAIVNTLVKGATIGLGVVAANAATLAVNKFVLGGKPMDPAVKIGLKAGVGVAGYFGLKAAKQGAFANAFLLGAGIAVALDAYDTFIKPSLITAAPWLADYDYGSLQGYRQGVLQGWAPQAGMGDWAPQLSGDMDAYGNGAYD